MKLQTTNYKLQTTRGFTLIEIIVSLAIFSIVLISAMGVFLLSLRAQRVVVIEKMASENVRFALEFMSRSMRFTQRYNAEVGQPAGCLANGASFISSSSSDIQFINVENRCVKFALLGDAIMYWEDIIANPSASINLTNSSTVSVDSLDFSLLGEIKSDIQQPRVTIVIKASGAGSSVEASGVKLNIQTSVTSRELDTP